MCKDCGLSGEKKKGLILETSTDFALISSLERICRTSSPPCCIYVCVRFRARGMFASRKAFVSISAFYVSILFLPSSALLLWFVQRGARQQWHWWAQRQPPAVCVCVFVVACLWLWMQVPHSEFVSRPPWQSVGIDECNSSWAALNVTCDSVSVAVFSSSSSLWHKTKQQIDIFPIS